MLLGTMLLALLYGVKILSLLAIIWRATKSYTTGELIIVLILIMILEHLFIQHGYMDRMLNGLKEFINNSTLVMVFLPAFIGLLPSAGGARFSAPLVEHTAEGVSVSAEEKSFINYYFRHIWEYCLPFSPAILLTAFN